MIYLNDIQSLFSFSSFYVQILIYYIEQTIEFTFHTQQLLPSTYYNGSYADYTDCDNFEIYSSYLDVTLFDKAYQTRTVINQANSTTLSSMYVGCGDKYYSYSNPTTQGQIYCKADMYYENQLRNHSAVASLNNVGKAYYYDPDIAIFDDMSGQKYLNRLNCDVTFKINALTNETEFTDNFTISTIGNLYSTGGWMAYRDKSVSSKFYLLGTTGNGKVNYVSVDPQNNYNKENGSFTINDGETIITMQSQKEGSILTTIQNNTIRNYKIREDNNQVQLVLYSEWDSSEIYQKYLFLDRYLNTSTLFEIQHVILFHQDYLTFTSQYQRFETILTLYRPIDGDIKYFTLNFFCQDNLTSNGQNMLLCHQPNSIVTVDLNNLLDAPENFTVDRTSCYLIPECVDYQLTTQGDNQFYKAVLKNTSQLECEECNQSKDINLYYQTLYEKVIFSNINNTVNCTYDSGIYYDHCENEEEFSATISNLPSVNHVFASDSFVSVNGDNKLISSQSVSESSNFDSCYTIANFQINITDNFIYYYPNDSNIPTCVADQPKITASISSGISKETIELKPTNLTKYQQPITYYGYMDPAFSKTITTDTEVTISITSYTSTNEIYSVTNKTIESDTVVTSCYKIPDSINVTYLAGKGQITFQPQYILGKRFQQPCSMNMSDIDVMEFNITFNDTQTFTLDQYNFVDSKLLTNLEEAHFFINPQYDSITSASVFTTIKNVNTTLQLYPKIIALPCIMIEDVLRIQQDGDYTYLIISENGLCNCSLMPNPDELVLSQYGDEYEADDYYVEEDGNGIKRYVYQFDEQITGLINITYNITLLELKEIEFKKYYDIRVIDAEEKTDTWYIPVIIYICAIIIFIIATVLIHQKVKTGMYPWQNSQFKNKYQAGEESNQQRNQQSFSFSSQNEDDILFQDDSGSGSEVLGDNKDEDELFDVPQ